MDERWCLNWLAPVLGGAGLMHIADFRCQHGIRRSFFFIWYFQDIGIMPSAMLNSGCKLLAVRWWECKFIHLLTWLSCVYMSLWKWAIWVMHCHMVISRDLFMNYSEASIMSKSCIYYKLCHVLFWRESRKITQLIPCPFSDFISVSLTFIIQLLWVFLFYLVMNGTSLYPHRENN